MTDATATAPEEMGLPAGAPQALADAASGAKVSKEGERSALDFLLGPTRRLQYTLPVEFETEEGMKTLRFRIQQMDDRRLQFLDNECREGDGPFAKLDKTAFNVAVCAEAVLWIEDDSGRKVVVESPEFIGGAPTPRIAMEVRFKYQPGILDSVVTEVQRISGYSPGRVGSAQRVMIAAVGGS